MPRSRRILTCLLLLWSLPAPLFARAGGADKVTAKTINIGVVYYNDFEDKLKEYKDYTDKLKVKTGGKYDFRLAVGTYDDLLEWYKKGEIDVAVMTPGMISILLTSTDLEEEIRNAYIATLGITPKREDSYASEKRLKQDGDAPFSYYSVALVSEKAAQTHGINTIDDLVAFNKKRPADKEGKPAGVEFIFVHPLSVSGHILPKFLLQQKGFTFTPNNYSWTYNHSESLRQLLASKPGETPEHGPLKVAFIADETKVVSGMQGAAGAAAVGGIQFSKGDFRPLRFPELDGELIPQDVLLLRPGAGVSHHLGTRGATAKEIREVFALANEKDVGMSLREVPDWIAPYKRISEWVGRIDPGQHLATPFSTLDQIVARVVNYDRQSRRHARDGSPHGARLALVLSGGGAKCAYQLGAVEAIEQELDKHLNDQGARKVDISLVVGTSGGAINALCVALGLTKNEDKQAKLRETWKSFKQENFLQPWERVRLPIGLLLGLLQAILLMRLTLVLEAVSGHWTERINFWTLAGIFLIVLGACQILIDKREIQISQIWTFVHTYMNNQVKALISLRSIFAPGKPKAHGMNHLLLHSWAVLTPTFIYSGLVLIVTGACMVVGRNHPVQKLIARAQTRFQSKPLLAVPVHTFMDIVLSRRALISYLQSVALICLLVMILLPLLPYFTIHSLSDSKGVEEALAREVPRLIDLSYDVKDGKTPAQRLEDISEHIVRQDLLKRDMVITGSRLPATAEEVDDERYRDSQSTDPDDMYFFYDHKDPAELTTSSAAAAPGGVSDPLENVLPGDRRFVPFQLRGNSRKLLDVVIGSSSIYPLFQPRPLKRIKLSPGDKGRDVNIIDGGFVHNSPIEAAILWGATHIILIEATPASQPSEQQNLYSNALAAFDYLYTQAQIIDARSRGKIEIFTLRPLPAKTGEDPNSDLLDFSADLIEGAIGKGYNDALNVAEPRFRREPGPPRF